MHARYTDARRSPPAMSERDDDNGQGGPGTSSYGTGVRRSGCREKIFKPSYDEKYSSTYDVEIVIVRK